IDNINGGSGYAAYDGEHEVEFGSSTPKPVFTYESSNVMLQESKLQFRSTPGYIYSTKALSYIQSVTVVATAGSPIVYYGTTEHPTSRT
ncbi:hypothetical protein ACP3W2_24510, partial [Salmonella enterica]|uniref:hypothetical protein n=1 Tax=Salmonella enterica TaxID=28901 RepID=UPI003CEB0E63